MLTLQPVVGKEMGWHSGIFYLCPLVCGKSAMAIQDTDTSTVMCVGNLVK